jgi:hypothetical protein
MKPNNRITYRFDVQGAQTAKDKPEREKVVGGEPLSAELDKHSGQALHGKNNVVPLYQRNAANGIGEVQPWNNAYQEDIGALEQLIREADAEAEAEGAQPPVEPSTPNAEDLSRWPAIVQQPSFSEAKSSEKQWPVINPDAEWISRGGDSGYQPSVEPFGNRQSPEIIAGDTRRTGGKGPSWLHVFLSVSGALATGAIFGYLILTLFTGGPAQPDRDTQGDTGIPVVQPGTKETIGLDDLTGVPVGSKEGEGGKDGKNGEVVDPGAANAATVNVAGIQRTYTLLQYGVFSNTEGRDAALGQLKDIGLAGSSMKTPEGYRVYAGIALDGTKAAVVIGGLPDILLYKKEVAVQGPDKLTFAGGAEKAEAFFAATNDLIGTWSDLVVAQLEQPSLSKLGKAASEGWQAQLAQWTANAAEMESGLPEDVRSSYFVKLKKAMDTAAGSMKAYDENPSKAQLWSVQTALMEAVLVQKEWFESPSAL